MAAFPAGPFEYRFGDDAWCDDLILYRDGELPLGTISDEDAGSYDYRHPRPCSSTQRDSRVISHGHAGRVHLFVLSNVQRSTRALQGCGFLAWLVRMGTQMLPRSFCEAACGVKHQLELAGA